MSYGQSSIRIILLLVLSGALSAARAGEPSAKEFFANGRTSYNLGHFEEALKDFESAYRIKQDPAFLFNIGQCQRSLNRYSEALRSYRTYLRETPKMPDTTREQVKRLISEMEKAVEEVRAQQPPMGVETPAEKPAAPEPAPVAPVPSPVATMPPPAVTAQERAPSRPMIIGGAVTAAVGVAALATGVAFGVLAKNAGDTLTKNDNQRLPFDNATFQDGKRDQILEGVLIGVGAAAVVGGVVVAILGARHGRSSHAAISPSNGGMAVRF